MRVADKRWGEVSIKKQGEVKNRFDKSKSFSILKSKNEYSIDQLTEIYQLITNLTDDFKFEELKEILQNLDNEVK